MATQEIKSDGVAPLPGVGARPALRVPDGQAANFHSASNPGHDPQLFEEQVPPAPELTEGRGTGAGATPSPSPRTTGPWHLLSRVLQKPCPGKHLGRGPEGRAGRPFSSWAQGGKGARAASRDSRHRMPGWQGTGTPEGSPRTCSGTRSLAGTSASCGHTSPPPRGAGHLNPYVKAPVVRFGREAAGVQLEPRTLDGGAAPGADPQGGRWHPQVLGSEDVLGLLAVGP